MSSNNIIVYLTEQGDMVNEYRKRLTNSIDNLKQILANDSVFYLYSLFNSCNFSQSIISDNIRKTKSLLASYKYCIELINEDEKERQEIIKSGFDSLLVNSYYEKSYHRNAELIKHLV